jgi:bacteriocin-like protein
MKNFEELSFEEMQRVEGGLGHMTLWTPSSLTYSVTNFFRGFKMGFYDGLELK